MASMGVNVALIAVTGGESVEVVYRVGLRVGGRLEFLGGKPD
jgi:hypothetical protein